MIEYYPIDPNDLPNDLKDRMDKLKKYENFVDIINMKDEIIWQNILDKKNHDISTFGASNSKMKTDELEEKKIRDRRDSSKDIRQRNHKDENPILLKDTKSKEAKLSEVKNKMSMLDLFS